jgi:hypothetical protein
VAHQFGEPPGIHAGVGLDGAGGVAQAVRMHWPGDLGFAPRGRDQLVDCKSGEGLAPLRGEDVRSLGLLLTLQTLEAASLITFQVVSAVDAALEPADLNGAFASVEIVPSKIDELRDPQAVQERHQGDHVVAVAVAVLLQRSEQSVELVLRKRLALAAVGLSLGPFMFDIPLYSLISRLELMHRHWLSPSLQDSTWHIVV